MADSTGDFLGSFLNDPQQAALLNQARQQQGFLGLAAGMAQPTPGGAVVPIGAGLLGMLQAQNSLPQQAQETAGAANQAADSVYKRLQGQQLGIQMARQPAYWDTLMKLVGGGGEVPSANTPTQPGAQPSAQPGATTSGISPYAAKTIQFESPNGQGGNGGGYGQFQKDTWLSTFKNNSPMASQMGDDAILALRNDPQVSGQMIDAYGRENAQILANAGIPINDATLRGAHWLGPGNAVKVFSSSPDTPLANFMSKDVLKANNLTGMTTGDFSNKVVSQMGAGTLTVPGLAPANTGAQPGQPVQTAQATPAPGGTMTATGQTPQAGQMPAAQPSPYGNPIMSPRNAAILQMMAPMAGLTAPPFTTGLANLPADIAKAQAEAEAQQRARAGYAGVRQGNINAANNQTGPSGNPELANVYTKEPDGSYKLNQVPKYMMNDPAAVNAYLYGPPAQTGSSLPTPPAPPQAAPTPIQPSTMPGTNLGVGGAQGALQPRPLVPNVPAPGPQSTAGAIPGAQTASPTPSGPVAAPAPGGMSQFGKPENPVINPLYAKGVEGAQAQDTQRMEKVIQPAADQAIQTAETAGLIQDLMPKVRMGWGADTIAQGSKILSSMYQMGYRHSDGTPITPEEQATIDKKVQAFTGTSSMGADVLNKMFLQQSAGAVRLMGAREPGSVISLFAKAYPNLETNPLAAQLMENVFQMQSKYAQDRLAGAQAHQNQNLENLRVNGAYTPLTNFETKFNSGPNNPELYMKAAEVMSSVDKGWRNSSGGMLSQKQQAAIYTLIPSGTQYMRPDGKMDVKP